MRTLSADWMANTNKSESELQSSQHGGEENKGTFFYPRAVAPTAAQVCIISYSPTKCCNIVTIDFLKWKIYLNILFLPSLWQTCWWEIGNNLNKTVSSFDCYSTKTNFFYQLPMSRPWSILPASFIGHLVECSDINLEIFNKFPINCQHYTTVFVPLSQLLNGH